MKKILFYFLIIIFLKKKINCGSKPCFEYSCDECETEEYGKCTKCRDGFQLIDGTCPCSDSSCALCQNGFAGYNLCRLCKKGYYNFLYDCYCMINNCEQCSENGCYKCIAGYFFNDTSRECEEENEENKFKCYDEHCEFCTSDEKGGCEYCLDGYIVKRGECYQLPIPDENNTCPEGYYFSMNKCKEKCGGINCTKANINIFGVIYYTCPSNKCLVCVNNELQIFSECDNSEECSLMKGCLNCITSDECLICNQGYYLLGGTCIKCIEGCSICSNNSTCEYCMSGYAIDSEKKCNLTNDFDFNLDVYNNYKNRLIKTNFPEEIPIVTIPIKSDSVKLTEELSENMPETQIKEQNNKLIIDCDKNCIKCLQNTGECLECDKSYTLRNNKCIQCPENCLSCSFKNGFEVCNRCKSGYDLEYGKCSRECIDDNCNDCPNDSRICKECKSGRKLFDGICGEESVACPRMFPNCHFCYKEEKCLECIEGFEVDKATGLTCKKKTNFASIIFTILGIGIIFVGLISFCVYQKRKSDLRNEMRRIRLEQEHNANNVNVYSNRNALEISGSSRSVFSKEDLADEFEIQKGKMEKGKQMCQYCKKKIAKFKCDYGCLLCKDHSNLKKIEKKGKNYKVCFACNKVAKKVTQLKYPCHICFQDKLNVAHFKCGCALEVCKNCYIKCKMSNNKCPGCRALI